MPSLSAGQWIAEHDRSDYRPVACVPAHEDLTMIVRGPVWERARMDAETVIILAAICGCSLQEFSRRYA
jgi:hypothetical protein